MDLKFLVMHASVSLRIMQALVFNAVLFTCTARYVLRVCAMLAIVASICQAAVLAPMEERGSQIDISADLVRYHAELDARALEVLRAASRLEGHEEIVDIQSLADRVLFLAQSGLRMQALRKR